MSGSDETGRRGSISTWSFEVLRRDTTVPEYGPGGSDCAHGVRVDTVEFDQSFECDCEGSAFTGPNCASEDLPFLMIESSSSAQYVPAGDTVSDFTFYNRTKWGWGITYQLAPFNLMRAYTVHVIGGQHVERNVADVTFFLEWEEEGVPRGFFLDGSTGEALIRIPRVARSLRARLVVGASGVRSAVAANLTFLLLPTDVDEGSSAEGPGGQIVGATVSPLTRMTASRNLTGTTRVSARQGSGETTARSILRRKQLHHHPIRRQTLSPTLLSEPSLLCYLYHSWWPGIR